MSEDPAARDSVLGEVHCVGCGYDLRGLRADGRCPECGVDVIRSVTGNLLVLSARDYLHDLHRGVFVILTTIILQIALTILALLLGLALGAFETTTWLHPGVVVLELGSVALEGALIYGWWLFSAPDPAIVGPDTGDRPRRIVRVTLVVSAVALVFNTALEYLNAGGATDTVMAVLVGTVAVINVVAYVVKFFASMLYIRWLAPRLPDERVAEKAKTLMWLGPLLMTVGALVLVGPLIALLLYLALLNRLRKHLKRIRVENTDRFG